MSARVGHRAARRANPPTAYPTSIADEQRVDPAAVVEVVEVVVEDRRDHAGGDEHREPDERAAEHRVPLPTQRARRSGVGGRSDCRCHASRSLRSAGRVPVFVEQLVDRDDEAVADEGLQEDALLAHDPRREHEVDDADAEPFELAEVVRAGSPPSTNCEMKSPNSIHASCTLMLRFTSTAIANTDCAAVRNSSSRWSESRGRPARCPAEIANTIGSEPTSSVHWFTFDDSSVPKPGARLEPPREHPGDDELRRLRRERCDPLHEQEGVDARLLTEVHERLGERLGAQRRSRPPRTRAGCRRRRVAASSGASRSVCDGPTRCGSSDGARAMRITNTTKMPIRITASTRSACASAAG